MSTQWWNDTTFLDQHKPAIDLATAAYRLARLAAEQGEPALSALYKTKAEQTMIEIEQLYEVQKAAHGPA